MLRTLVIIMGVLLLSACGPIYQTSYDYIPPKSQNGKMCLMQCQQSKMLCQQSCDLKQQACRADAQRNATFAYENYRQQQENQHQPINKTVQDFYSDFECSRSSCTCEDDYRTCFTTCGGKVLAHQQCVAFCDKNNL